MLPLMLALVLPACKDTAADTADPTVTTPDVDRDCDPLAPDHCGSPFPSTYFMEQDDSTASGWRVALGPTTLPLDMDGYQPDPQYWNEFDGWSVMTMATVLLPGVSLDGVIPFTDLGTYADPAAKTVIIDVDTGERHPHWVELDMSSPDPDRATLILRPATPYEYGHHYVVGLRDLVDSSGQALPPSAGMAALIAGEATGDPRIDDRQALYDDTIFPTLEADGWTRDQVQLAWDFVTASQESLTGRALWMRDDALERIGDDGPDYVITEVEDDFSEAFVKVIHLTLTVPMYTESDRPPTLLTRDADGMPYYNGDTEVDMVVAIPRSIVDAPEPAPIVQYGHGFFGEKEEAYDTWADWNEMLATDNGWIYYAVDWTGMAASDASWVALTVATAMGDFAILPERTQQGFIQAICASRLMTGALASDPEMMLDDPETGDPVTIVDTSRHWFYGISQGGILGGGYLALHPDIERAAFGVTGAPYTLLTSRSTEFDDFFMLFEAKYDDPADILYWQAVMQTPWDSGEAAGYTNVLTRDPLPGTPAKQVLIQNAIGDAQVSTIGGRILARAYDAALIDAPARDVWGLDTQPSGWTGSALVEWDYGVTEPTDASPPDTATDTHDHPRHEAAAQLQLVHFFETGETVNYCDGPCDLEDSTEVTRAGPATR